MCGRKHAHSRSRLPIASPQNFITVERRSSQGHPFLRLFVLGTRSVGSQQEFNCLEIVMQAMMCEYGVSPGLVELVARSGHDQGG